MNGEKMKILRSIVGMLNMILMCITMVLALWSFEVLRHTILCSCSLLLSVIQLILDGTMKDFKQIHVHIFCFLGWLFILIISIFKF